MREFIAWAIPILVSLFLIQTAAELLSMRASVQVRNDAGGKRETILDTIRGLVHKIDHAVTASGIIT
jgi:hypothetical protein